MSDPHRESRQELQPTRRRRKFVAMPVARERAWLSPLVSLFIHASVILLLIMPSIKPNLLLIEEQGAGGPGPAGGGGGGNRGTGGVVTERIQYVKPVEAPPVEIPRIIPPIEEKKPVVVPPPVPIPPVAAVKADSAKSNEATAPVPGVGGGTGNDGSGGTGPGSGGGKGSGIGTGTGSSIGPGTGGGTGTVYPPSVTQLVVLPIPIPSKVRGYELEATFDVDSTGHATLLQWNEPKDGAYAKKVLERLLGFRFRPAVRLDGTPVRGTVTIRASVGKD